MIEDFDLSQISPAGAVAFVVGALIGFYISGMMVQATSVGFFTRFVSTIGSGVAGYIVASKILDN